MSAVSWRTSSTGVENHLSMERFINPYANQNITMTGINDSSRLPTTRRVRNFDPRTPSRRSANSLIRLRARTNVSVTNSRNTRAESAARKTVCWLLAGLINGRSNDDSDSNTPNSSKLPIERKIMSFLRLGFGGNLSGETMRSIISGEKATNVHYMPQLRLDRGQQVAQRALLAARTAFQAVLLANANN